MKYLPALGLVVIGIAFWIGDLRFGASFLFGSAFGNALSHFEEGVHTWPR